ncbi:MAG: SUMF1/EgtB/PvdO family nonheme iron enzyme [Deltaproteobacteria bacterium]|nr:SUMF1/EgtB/PvdO family nonheme iron enzyme [Deltaproteobacteria bacterium]MBW2120287.1 SUMF1/EgtB/PvdO family nonheme iron enzyme [Deltaproteobacteria bacterium]
MKREWNILEQTGGPPFPAEIRSPHDDALMILIPEGPFTMGIDRDELMQIFALDGKENPVFATEVPARQVHTEAYYIDKYPVTNAQYERFLLETGHRIPLLWEQPGWSEPDQPVVGLGWDDARAYSSWAGKALPSEAQWEKAARGTDRFWWPWGNDFYPGRCNSAELGIGRTTPVTRFPEGASPYGCYDMSGNVWEMCEGFWVEDMPLMKGGCFLGRATFVRASTRWSPEDPDGGAQWLGFRCVKEIPRTGPV